MDAATRRRYRFARHVPAVVLAGAVAEVAGAAGVALIREVTGMSGTGSTAIVERALFLVLAIPAGMLLSRLSVRRWWSTPEVAATLAAVASSFWLGPILLDLATSLLGAVSLDVDLLRSEVTADLFWGLAIVMVLLPARYAIWQSYGSVRTHAAYGRLRRVVVGTTSSEADTVDAAVEGLTELRLVATPRTGPLVEAVTEWIDAWRAAPTGLDPDVAHPLTLATAREMEALFGPPLQDA